MAASDTSGGRDWIVTPGEILAEALDERGMSQSELARRMGRPTKTVNEIVNAKAAVTPETALQLELVLGVSASLWVSLEARYRQFLATQRARRELANHSAWLRAFPLRDLARQDLLDLRQPLGEQVAQVLAFFGVASPDAWERQWTKTSAAYRQSAAFEGSLPARAAWLRWGEILGRQLQLAPFDADRTREAARLIRTYTRITPVQAALDEAREQLSRAGVALVVVPEFDRTRLSGAARWLTHDAAIVQLSLRHKTDDHLWFTCMHEIGHLLDRPRHDFLDADDDSAPADPDAEARANAFARDALIDPRSYRAFVERGTFEQATVRDLAAREGVAPGIVVGRLQHDRLLRPSQLNHLKRPVRFD